MANKYMNIKTYKIIFQEYETLTTSYIIFFILERRAINYIQRTLTPPVLSWAPTFFNLAVVCTLIIS